MSETRGFVRIPADRDIKRSDCEKRYDALTVILARH